MKRKQNLGVVFDTDCIAKKTFNAMSSDFVTLHGTAFADPAKELVKGVTAFRDYEWIDYRSTLVPRFKAWYQLENLFKKYSFRNDKYTSRQLEINSYNDYLQFQKERAVHIAPSYRAFLVLQEARRIVRTILGAYPDEKVIHACRFGKNSSIGCSFANSYLDYKLSNECAFTGTSSTAYSFKEDYLPGDPLLQSILKRNGLNEAIKVESLTLILVPKSWKTLRAITPLTSLALFRSYGIGEMITERLEEHGLSIKRLQDVHRRIIRNYSVTRSHVTADLSKASDSITSELLNRVLPRDWYREIRKTLTHKINIDGSICYTESVLPMGNGLTFPCETLIFYSIIKAIGTLLGKKGRYSVYGDDLIYPRSIHRYVLSIFEDLGVKINREKTFCDSYFRESCGADYYMGVDVRPFFFPVGHNSLTKTSYICYLHKVINGLKRRWSYEELPQTFSTLLIELAWVSGTIYRVPPSFPDTAGIKVSYPDEVPSMCRSLPWHPILRGYQKSIGSRHYMFSFMRETSKKRFVIDVEPYYWEALGRSRFSSLEDFWEDDCSPSDPNWKFWETENNQSELRPSVSWCKTMRVRRYYDGKGRERVKKSVKYRAAVADKQRSEIAIVQTGRKSEINEGSFLSDWV